MDYPREVYAIQHNVTKRIYIGSSKDALNRYQSHMWALRKNKHSVEDMQEDFNEYGENFTLFILEEVTKRDRCRAEYEWMRKYNTTIRGIGYNYKDHVGKSTFTHKATIPLKVGFPDTTVFNDEVDSIKEEYILSIKKLLKSCDIPLLDFVKQFIEKSVGDKK